MIDTGIPERRTADGVVVKRGDFIWRVRGVITRSKVSTSTLRHWEWWQLHLHAYADERKAMEAALADAKKDLERAKRDMRNAARRVQRITERMR